MSDFTAQPIRPFDDNFLSSDSPHFNSDFFTGDSDSVAGNYTEAPNLPEDESLPLREWRRKNAVQLAEKERTEKELLEQILVEANVYRVEFLEKQQIRCENKKSANRENEKLFLESKEKFDADADKSYWKSIAELIPTEVPDVKKRGEKGQEKKPSVDVIQGPKPGRRTDLSRMRQILMKLKDDSPAHLKLSSPTGQTSAKGTTAGGYQAIASVASRDAGIVS